LYGDIKRQSRYANDLTKNQLAWLKERNSCKTDLCVLDKYRAREVELNSWLLKEAVKASELENCTDRPECLPEGSAMRTGLTLVAELEKISAQLKAKHGELVALLSDSPDYNGDKYPGSRVISALVAQQVSWEKYRSDECELIGSLTGAGGTFPSTYANSCDVELTEWRLQLVNLALECVQQIPLEDRWAEQAECLQRLTTLAGR
jgi:uncharacterized protein YecT (DUF1311 family)